MMNAPSRASRIRLAWLGLTGIALASAAEPLVKELHHPDGSLRERYAYVLDGQGQEVRQGLDEEFYHDGTPKGVRTWKDGRIEGTVVYYHPNGRKSYETHYVEGRKNGFATVWYLNGQKQWQTTFKSGKTHGRWREWHPDGKKKFEGNYSEGNLDGLATWWHENGRLWQERAYREGQPVPGTVKEWDRTGRQTYPPAAVALEGVVPEAAEIASPGVVPPSTAAKIEGAR